MSAISAIRASIDMTTSQADLEEVFQLRYKVYVEEMGKPYATRTDGLLRDPLDSLDPTQFVARDSDGRIIACMRVAWGDNPLVAASYKGIFNLDSFSDYSARAFAFVSRLIVAHEWRHNRWVGRKLTQAGYRTIRDRKCELVFVHSRENLVPLFRHLGFVCYGKPFYDRESGSMQVRMVLAVNDRQHLESVNSPFAELAHGETSGERARYRLSAGRLEQHAD